MCMRYRYFTCVSFSICSRDGVFFFWAAFSLLPVLSTNYMRVLNIRRWSSLYSCTFTSICSTLSVYHHECRYTRRILINTWWHLKLSDKDNYIPNFNIIVITYGWSLWVVLLVHLVYGLCVQYNINANYNLNHLSHWANIAIVKTTEDDTILTDMFLLSVSSLVSRGTTKSVSKDWICWRKEIDQLVFDKPSTYSMFIMIQILYNDSLQYRCYVQLPPQCYSKYQWSNVFNLAFSPSPADGSWSAHAHSPFPSCIHLQIQFIQYQSIHMNTNLFTLCKDTNGHTEELGLWINVTLEPLLLCFIKRSPTSFILM